ncbi:uncharacterized protein LOC126705193 [Quercus robur]|uniref:uncharacterized protein LOC126705193 n=1 Tax=Quercus robur TaxID=38942 RepID=UPI0021629F64|nr:uncharacterized protein LOC126705193 [Quercus robur]
MSIEIKEALGVPEILHYDKYLGLPSLMGKHKKVWAEDPQWSLREQMTFQDFPQLLLHVFELGCNVELFVVQLKKTAAAPSVRPRVRWLPPSLDWYKANIDAAIFQDDGRAGIGVIIHDSRGLFMVSLTQNVQLSILVVEMEALAATRAIALELGYDRIIFEGDPDTIMRALTNQSPPFGLLIREAQACANWLNWVKFQHFGRDGNNVAHNLARHRRHVTCFSI